MPEPRNRDLPVGVAVGLILLGAFVLRLWVGVIASVDADQATLGLESMKILHGQQILMEMNGHYLGGLEGYYVAPFIAVLGPTKLALRLPLALVGTVYVLTLFALGRAVLPGRWPAVGMAALAALSPGYLVAYTMRPLGGHAELPMFVALLLLLATRVGWGGRSDRAMPWVLLGLCAGLGTWSDPSLAFVVLLVAVFLLLRAPAIGWMKFLRGSVVATAATLAGFSPWLYFNLRHHMLSITSLRDSHPNAFGGIQDLTKALTLDIPAFLGARFQCDITWVPTALPSYVAIGVLLLGLATYRTGLVRRLTGVTSSVEAAPLILTVGLGAVAVGVLGAGNVPPCDARLMLPLGPPLIFAVVLLATTGWPGRLVAVAGVSSLLILSIFYLGALPRDNVSGPEEAAARYLQQRAAPAYAYYWTGRAVMYFSGGKVSVAQYRGTPTFPEVQAAADASDHPAWIFQDDDPDLKRWLNYAAANGITYDRWQQGSVVVLANVSRAIRPHEAGLDFPAPRP